VALLTPGTPWAQKAATAPAAKAPQASKAPAAAKPARPLPDSVLVRIDGREDVTVRRFRRAVRLLGGDPDSLTPGDRDRFLDLVLEQRVLAAHVTRHPKAWIAVDSARFQAERDQVLLRAALSDRFSAVEERRRGLGQPDLDEQAMGVAARESLLVELKPAWDEPLLRRVAQAFAALPQPTPEMRAKEQMALLGKVPDVAPADTARVLVRTTLGGFTVAELLQDWRRLNTIYHPKVSDQDAVRMLVGNSL